ncbi:hypothetical protein CDAR_185621 [Caerostris darwini]|uniref:Uncharacterized protein n=1 Tax=Caerostris darwini TaxID=1538125 RepID=A0AAV4TCG3_9ARAC|nr:hypothetical protein CDAR_185621 [Caerostris darwini]
MLHIHKSLPPALPPTPLQQQQAWGEDEKIHLFTTRRCWSNKPCPKIRGYSRIITDHNGFLLASSNYESRFLWRISSSSAGTTIGSLFFVLLCSCSSRKDKEMTFNAL